MSFKHLYRTVFLLGLTINLSAQVKNKRYKWKHLGPEKTAISDSDTGRWTPVGQGWIEDFIITDKEWYAGSVTGGLYKSKNNGKRWKKVDTDTLQQGTLSLLKVGNTIFRGTGLTHFGEKFGFGIFKSTNNGKTWEPTGLQTTEVAKEPVWDICYSDIDDVLYACTPSSVFKSNDMGDTWSRVFNDENANFRTVLTSNSISNKVWGTGSSMVVSLDGGNTWIDKTTQMSLLSDMDTEIGRIALAEDPNIPERYLAFYGRNNTGYIDETLDGGVTWNRLIKSRNIRRTDVHHTEIAIAPGNSSCIVLGTYRTYLSLDNGKSFKPVTYPTNHSKNFAHDDIRELFVKSASEFYIGTDGGLFRTLDTAKTWQNISGKGLTAMQIYGLNIQKDGSVIMGCQDMGYFVYNDKKWKQLGNYYGDGGDAIETSTGTYIIISGRLRKIDVSKTVGYKNKHPDGKHHPFIAKLIPYPGAQDSFYYIGNDIWFYDEVEWMNYSKDLDGNKQMVMGFDINKKNPKQLFMSFDQPTWNSKNLTKKFFKSIDGGKTWVDYTAKLPILAWHHIVSISTDEHNPDEVIVSLGRMDATQLHKVYKSMDGGETWINYSDGIPPYETFKIQHLENTDGVILSSLGGLFYRNSKMNSWQRVGGKIPPISIRDFEIDMDNRYLYAGTYGNGLWRLKIPRKWLRN